LLTKLSHMKTNEPVEIFSNHILSKKVVNMCKLQLNCNDYPSHKKHFWLKIRSSFMGYIVVNNVHFNKTSSTFV
jgi:hypothetical protein